MSPRAELGAAVARLDAMGSHRPCSACVRQATLRRRIRSIAGDLLFVTFFVLGMLAFIFLAFVLMFALADFPAHA